MSFESTIDDKPAETPILEAISQALNSSRSHPEAIYVREGDKASVEAMLSDLYGIRGNRVQILAGDTGRERFSIKWAAPEAA